MKKLAPALVLLLIAAACTGGGGDASNKGATTASQEQQAVQTGFNRLSNTQQIPTFDWSQERQTLIDTETIRATGAATTSAGYLEGVGLIWWCPSLGSPVPSTYQLSGSSQYVDIPDDGERTKYPVDQGEPTGVYIGPSTGTWTICLDDSGKKFAQYWEGYVSSTTGTLAYPDDKRVRPTGSTFTFGEKPG